MRFSLTLTLIAWGCTSTTGALKTRFANERGCPENDVTVVESGGFAYSASGCGQAADYVCDSFATSSDDARRCEERGAPFREKPRSAVPQTAGAAGPEAPPR